MKMKKRLKPVLLLLLAVLTVISAVFSVSVLAKYTKTETVDDDAVLKYFDVGFEAVGGTTDDDGIVTLTVSEYNSFKLILHYKGYGKAFVRVLIEESWIKVDTATGIQTVLTASSSPTYSYDATAVKNIDGYLYLGPISGTKDITVISGVKATAPTGATLVKLSIKIEAVQYNRTQAFWGVSAAAITP